MKKLKKDIFLKLMFNFLKSALPVLPESTKIEKVEKIATNLHDKNEYVIHKRSLKQALNN